jgi:glycosyltransferase involved in cell wall biosynthesis
MEKATVNDAPRTLFFSADIKAPGIDGPLTNAINIAKSFADAGFPAIFVYNGKQEVFDRFVATGADVRRFEFPIGSWKTHLNPLSRRKYSRKLAEFIEDEKIEVVHTFFRASYLFSYLRGTRVLKVAEQVYASPDPRPLRMFDNGFNVKPRALLNAWYRRYVRFNFSAADLVTTNGQAQKTSGAVAYGVPHEKMTVVSPGVSSQLSSVKSGLVRREFGISDDEKVVLSVGRITEAKGVEEFGEIALILKERGNQCRFLFAGLGVNNDYVSEIKRRYGKYVTFIGHRSDIPNCLADADVYLHPSHREGMPISIIESMEFGLPAVVWDIPGCNELVTEGENGYLPKFGDVQAAADDIDRLLSDPDLYDRVSKAAKLRFQQNHDVANYAPRYVEAYKRTITNRTS